MTRAGFAKGLVACLAVLVALGIVVARLDHGHHRAEGTAERWLTAVSDTGRKGVRADAVKRAEKIGPITVADPLLPAHPSPHKALFPDLEVGKASISKDAVGAGMARVPYRLHQYTPSGTRPERSGVILMRRVGADWKVTGLGARQASERLPSEGGSPPSSAPGSVWLVAVLLGVAITAIASFLVEWASGFTRPRARAA